MKWRVQHRPETVLLGAAKAPWAKEELFLQLLTMPGVRADARTLCGETPLHLVAMKGWVRSVAALLDRRGGMGQVDVRRNFSNTTSVV